MCNYLVTDPFTNGEFISYQNIKEVIDRQNKGSHRQWIPERIKDAASAKIAQRSRNQHSPQIYYDWKTFISTVSDTTVLHSSRNHYLNLTTIWCGLLTMSGINHLPVSEISIWLSSSYHMRLLIMFQQYHW